MLSGAHSLNQFNETIGGYDRNGNIQSIARTGFNTLSMSYISNQLASVSGVSGSYLYDANGNMTKDPRKNLEFQYNSLNLLSEALQGNTVKARYGWAADGTKVSVRDAAGTGGYDYLGNVTLVKTSNTTTPEVAFAEGVIRPTGVTYFEKDHLGSVRATVSATGTVSGSYDYTPFGVRHTGSLTDPNNRFLFNGKENQITGNLGMLDYGARMYDFARWTTQDPLAEKYYSISPYAFTGNNPVRYVDPNGLWFDDYELDENGMIKLIEETEDDFDMLYAKSGAALQINDRSVLPNLAMTGAEKGVSYAHGNPSALASVFLFGSDNSSVEWRFSRYDVGNGDQYAVGTNHDMGNGVIQTAISPSQMGFDAESEIAFIHSHPTNHASRKSEIRSMGWTNESISRPSDSYNVSTNRYRSYDNYLAYFPHSGNIYQVRGYDPPAMIRNIKNHNYNPNRLFWGTLNGR